MEIEQAREMPSQLVLTGAGSHDPALTINLPAEDADEKEQETFSFLSLPLELRLKVYAYLLPPRHHTIVTQAPYAGFFYNTSPFPSANYPFGRAPPSQRTSYRVLTSNYHRAFPYPAIHPSILRVCRQVREEAEPVLYGGKGVKWDFGLHLEAMKSFWKERSVIARNSTKYVSFAKEIPCLANREGDIARKVDIRWEEFCRFISEFLPNVKDLDVRMWSSNGAAELFPTSKLPFDSEHVEESRALQLKAWQNWEWTKEILAIEQLRRINITLWSFKAVWDGGGSRFDSWLAGRMVSDGVVRGRMIREGNVIESSIILPGLAF
ncbi:hypothetical protein B0O99DRAFT_631846 [Bisporella sp. PMI_857]|nr:hypothetical protein B0O99DRAFT_631846 [Bisporella sp. PMI_857]